MNSQIKKNNQASEINAVFTLAKPFLIRSTVFSVVAALLALAPTFYMMDVYERVINSRNIMTLAMLTVLVVGVYAIMELLEWSCSESLREASHEVDKQLSPRVFEAAYLLNLGRNGNLTMQCFNDMRTVREFLHNPVVTAMLGSPAAVVFAVILFAINPLIGWAALLGATVQVVLTWLNERNTRADLQSANKAAISAQTYADATVRHAEVIEAMGMLPNIHSRWSTIQQEVLARQAEASNSSAIFQATTKWIQNSVGSGLLGLSAWLLLENKLPNGAAMMIVGSMLGGRILTPLVQIVSQWRAVIHARDAWVRLSELLRNTPSPLPRMSLPIPCGPLIAEGAATTAPGSTTPILRGVSFIVESGEVLAVIGPSASGKTSLARLVVGLWPSLQGKVRLSGVDVFQWSKEELGPYVGYVPQEVELLEGTIAENIARFGVVESVAIADAARIIGIHDWIVTLPKGYETQVGPEGANLSGGQRQRVGLARALYGSPKLLVLDEPNSSLDEEGEQALIQALSKIKRTGTIVVLITHRTNLLAITDKILLLRDGIAQAFGARDDVLANMKSGAYRQDSTRHSLASISPTA